MVNFKLIKGNELLVSFSSKVDLITDEQIKSITDYDDYPVVKYELIFDSSIKLGDIPDLGEIDPKTIKEAIVTIADKQ